MTKWRQNNPTGIGVIFIGCLLMACEKEIISPIPSLPVSVTLNLDFEDRDLIPLLATKSITQRRAEVDRIGFGGLLIINGYSSNGSINLFAYDLACPVEARRDTKVVPDNTGKAVCPACGAVYTIAYGTGVPDTISRYPLRNYMVSPAGGNKFIVRN